MPKKNVDWSSVVAVPTTHQERPPVNSKSELLTAKSEAVRAAIDSLKPITRFKFIAEATGWSYGYVVKSMKARFKDDPNAMWPTGNGSGADWHIPKRTAELWIRESFE